MNNPTDTNQTSEDDLRKKIDVILAANMPIHPEHQMDKSNIINNLIPLVRTEKLKLLTEVREQTTIFKIKAHDKKGQPHLYEAGRGIPPEVLAKLEAEL